MLCSYLNDRFAHFVRGILQRVSKDGHGPVGADQILHREGVVHEECHMTRPERRLIEILEALAVGTHLELATQCEIIGEENFHSLVHLQAAVDALQEPAHEPARGEPTHQLTIHVVEIRNDFRVVDSFPEHEKILHVCSKVVYHVVEHKCGHACCIQSHNPGCLDVIFLLYCRVSHCLDVLLDVLYVLLQDVLFDDFYRTVRVEQ